MKSIQDPWAFLRQFTHARIALGRAGHATPTNELLNFRLAHSRARDSVWSEVDFELIRENLKNSGYRYIEVQSRCHSKQDFLLNPNHGRELAPESRQSLANFMAEEFDTVLVIGDGLSANAIHLNAWSFCHAFLSLMKQSGISVGPVILGKYVRVGLGDAICEVLKAKSSIVLIGERPGLATSESLGVYYTYRPGRGCSDANRNCISNIHATGISPAGAAQMTEHLLKSSFHLQLSGIDLKVEYPALIENKPKR